MAHIGTIATPVQIHNWMSVTQVELVQETSEKINQRLRGDGLGVVSEFETKKIFLKMEGEKQKTFEAIVAKRKKQVSLVYCCFEFQQFVFVCH